MRANHEEKRDAKSAAVEKAIIRHNSPRIIGVEAKRRAVEREKIRVVKIGWSIYGGCWYDLLWCQRPVCASYTTP